MTTITAAPPAPPAPATLVELPSAAAQQAERRGVWWGPLLVLLAVLAALPGLIQVVWGPDDHDVAWVLYVAGRMLDGARLYRDIVEVNPPLVFLLNVPVVWVARLVGASVIAVYEVAAVGLIATMVGLSAALARRLVPAADAAGERRAFVVLLLVAVAAVPASSNVFGQREHVMVLLLLPYLIAAATRAAGRPLARDVALWVGTLAAVGIAFKPYFVFPWVLVEGYVALRMGARRAWLRPENVVIAVFGASYLLAVVVFVPEYIALVAVLREVYGDFLPLPLGRMMRGWRAAYVLAAVGAFLAGPRDGRIRELGWVVLLATVGFVGALAAQGKGWEYHWYPPVAGATILLGIALHGAMHGGAGLRARGVAAVAALCLAGIAVKVTRQVDGNLHPPPGDGYLRDLTPAMTRLMRERAAGGSVSALSSLPMPMFPAVSYTGVHWASRFFHLWALSGPYREQALAGAPLRYHPRAEMGPAEAFVFDGVVDDMRRQPPTLLLVMSPPNGTIPHPEFDYVEYFSQDARFAARMREYRLAGRLGPFRLFERRGTASAARGAP